MSNLSWRVASFLTANCQYHSSRIRLGMGNYWVGCLLWDSGAEGGSLGWALLSVMPSGNRHVPDRTKSESFAPK